MTSTSLANSTLMSHDILQPPNPIYKIGDWCMGFTPTPPRTHTEGNMLLAYLYQIREGEGVEEAAERAEKVIGEVFHVTRELCKRMEESGVMSMPLSEGECQLFNLFKGWYILEDDRLNVEQVGNILLSLKK